MRDLVPRWGIKPRPPGPLHRELAVLPTGPPGKSLFNLSSTLFSQTASYCYRIGQLDPYQGPSPGRDPLSRPGRFFFLFFSIFANSKTDAETGTAQTLFNGQRMEKQEPSSQINFFLTQLEQRHQIYRRVKVKGRELERGEGISTSYPRTGVGLYLETDVTLLFSLCMGFHSCCGAGGCVS